MEDPETLCGSPPPTAPAAWGWMPSPWLGFHGHPHIPGAHILGTEPRASHVADKRSVVKLQSSNAFTKQPQGQPTCCSSRGPGLSSQHPSRAAYHRLHLESQGILVPAHMYTHMNYKKILKKKKKQQKLRLRPCTRITVPATTEAEARVQFCVSLSSVSSPASLVI